MPADVAWRDHYVKLAKDGEQAGFTFNALGLYIAQRMTPAEMRAMLRDYYDTPPTTAARAGREPGRDD